MKGLWGSRRGITLLEVMISTIILGIMTISGTAFFAHAARIRMEARRQHASLIFANSLMELTYDRCDYDVYTNVVADAKGYFEMFFDSYGVIDIAYTSSDPSETWTFDGYSSLPVEIALKPVGGMQAVTIFITVTPPMGRDVAISAVRSCE